MTTRARAVDYQLSLMAEQLARHDVALTKLDSLCSTVQHHFEAFDILRKTQTESFDTLRTSLASQQAVMAEMLVKLQQLDRGPHTSHLDRAPPPSQQPPLLPLPSSPPVTHLSPHSPISPNPSNATSSTPSPSFPKLTIPVFSGDDILSWLFQITHYFNCNYIPDEQHLDITAYYMAGPALRWFHWLHSTSQLSTWETFVRQIELRFGPSSFVNHEASLYKLKQTSSVTAYFNDFEDLSTRVPTIGQQSLLNCFLSGLKDEIQHELYILKPNSLYDAMSTAKLIEDKCNAARLYSPRPPFPRPPPAISATPLSQRPPPLPIKRLSPAEMVARREEGLCFNCDSMFTPGHKCKPTLFLCLLHDSDDHPPPDGQPPPKFNPTPLLLPLEKIGHLKAHVSHSML